jgi:hypothetical protein
MRTTLKTGPVMLRFFRRQKHVIFIIYMGLIALLTELAISPWPTSVTLRHIASFPNCAAARVFNLAPAHRGNPGYYSRHDADNDGVACEKWPR